MIYGYGKYNRLCEEAGRSKEAVGRRKSENGAEVAGNPEYDYNKKDYIDCPAAIKCVGNVSYMFS